MKKIASICVAALAISAVSSVTFAATEGGYAGLGLGYSKQETPTGYLIPKDQGGSEFHQTRDVGGLGGRIFGGYNITKNFGIEAGIAQYDQSKYKFNGKNIAGSPGQVFNANGKLTYSMTALDLVGKAYLPISDTGLNVYALGGAAVVRSKAELKAQFSDNFGNEISMRQSETQTKIRPVVGLGASYDIPQTQLTTALEYSHIIGRGNVKTNSKAIPSANMVTLNLAYNIG